MMILQMGSAANWLDELLSKHVICISDSAAAALEHMCRDFFETPEATPLCDMCVRARSLKPRPVGIQCNAYLYTQLIGAGVMYIFICRWGVRS
jgi:hypothetical protein